METNYFKIIDQNIQNGMDVNWNEISSTENIPDWFLEKYRDKIQCEHIIPS